MRFCIDFTLFDYVQCSYIVYGFISQTFTNYLSLWHRLKHMFDHCKFYTSSHFCFCILQLFASIEYSYVSHEFGVHHAFIIKIEYEIFPQFNIKIRSQSFCIWNRFYWGEWMSKCFGYVWEKRKFIHFKYSKHEIPTNSGFRLMDINNAEDAVLYVLHIFICKLKWNSINLFPNGIYSFLFFGKLIYNLFWIQFGCYSFCVSQFTF